MLDSRQLTGRTSEHVIRIETLACVLHPQVAEPLLRLRDAAAAAGIDLAVASSFRDFERQRKIWNDKYTGRRPVLDKAGRPVEMGALSSAQRIEQILYWSALPGASRHHWGTDFDVFDRAAMSPGYQLQLTSDEYATGGPFAKLDEWLHEHAASHDFFRPYAIDRGGVLPEPWHLSYAPLAQRCLQALTPGILEEALLSGEIEGRAEILARLPQLHQRYCLLNAATTGV